ncbi:MAG: hypothetical protein QOI31_1761 [Solirubrobacterales bacterium]|nr:hypothetical protein [Solirubrobacterales bacterium]
MTARLEISMDGRGGLFYGGAVDRHNDRLIAYEMGIVVNLLQFLAAMGEVYEVGGYHGPVEIAYEVNGLRDAVGASRVGEFGFPPTPYGSDGARRDLRSQARTLRERPESVVRDLTLRLMQALTERDYDPLGDD